jgi:hypothetical protein
MEMLDAALALAITLAALATTVTVLMEIWVRVFGLKSKAQIELFTRIFDDAVQDRFPGSPSRGDFLLNVLANPLHDFSAMKKKAFRTTQKKEVPLSDAIGAETVPLGLQGKGIYEWVSHEHVYRNLLKLEGIVQGTREDMIARLQSFTRKYDEYCAAASLQFKDNRQRWSIIGGLLLAFAVNADGLRIYNELLKNPELAVAVSARVGDLERASRQAESSLQAALEGDKQGDLEAFQQTVNDMTVSLSDLQTTGIPIGWKFFPHCRAVDKGRGLMERFSKKLNEDCVAGGPHPEVKTAQDNNGIPSACLLGSDQRGGYLAWIGSLFAITGTGFLIGLGAPFWFDVARRLASVRSAFGASAGGEAAYSGESPDDRMPSKERAQAKANLITRIVDEVLGEHARKVSG